VNVPPQSSISPRRLYRSRRDRKLFGVAGGFAEYFNLDPALFRILFVGAVIFTGIFPGILFYIVCAIIVPEEPVGG
jgi:phage shock protein C